MTWGLSRLPLHGFGYPDRELGPLSVTITRFWLPGSRHGVSFGNLYWVLVTWIAAWSLFRLPLLGFGYPTLVGASSSVTFIGFWLPESRLGAFLGYLYWALVTWIAAWSLFRLPLLGFGYPDYDLGPLSVTFTRPWLPYSRRGFLFGNLYRVLVT